MITFNNNIFKIDTKNTSYIIRISRFNHLLNDYYGAKIENDENLKNKVQILDHHISILESEIENIKIINEENTLGVEVINLLKTRDIAYETVPGCVDGYQCIISRIIDKLGVI